jgi:hypothetical protein
MRADFFPNAVLESDLGVSAELDIPINPQNPWNSRNRIAELQEHNREVFDGLGYTPPPFFFPPNRGPRHRTRITYEKSVDEILSVFHDILQTSRSALIHTSPLTPPNFPAYYTRNPKNSDR